MAKMPPLPLVTPGHPEVATTTGPVAPVRPGREKSKKVLKGVGHGLGLFVTVLAAAGEASAARDAEAREIDREMSELAERRANLYGRTTRPTVVYGVPENRVQWDRSNPGHLINCLTRCSSKHCLDCGDSVSDWRVRCWNCS